MKLSIGNVAEGENYFARLYLNEKFWRMLQNSKHISIVAPRRVGKSSFIVNISTIEKEGYTIIYIITESIDNADGFFKKIYTEILNVLGKSKKLTELFADLIKKNNVIKFGLEGIEFSKNDLDFFEEIKFFLKRKPDLNIVMLIDEFSQTLENIVLTKGENEAKLFLHQCRELRLDPNCKDKINFVYTGSVGLENLVASIDELKSINDIAIFEVPPLNADEGVRLIDQILDNEDYVFNIKYKHYLLEKIKWILPFYIQIIMSEIQEICIESNIKIIDEQIIDNAFTNSLSRRAYFEHWESRLRIMFKGNEYKCVKAILDFTATNNELSKYEIANIALVNEIENHKCFINVLLHDGYIVSIEDNSKYRFASPLLQQWWINNCI
jgi:uncharacterized protein